MATDGPAVIAAHVVQYMLIAFWYLCTFAAVATALDVPFPRVFKEAVRLSAARGKTWDGKPSALGWFKDVSVPHVWFWHFYLVGLVCNGATLCLTTVPLVARAVSPPLYTRMAQPDNTDGSLEALTYMNVVSLLVMCMLQTHLVRRFVETLFVMRFPSTSRMHILAYIYGLAYYAVLSLTFVDPGTVRTAISLVFRSSAIEPSSSSDIIGQQEACSGMRGACDGAVGGVGVGRAVGEEDYVLDGQEMEDALVLDPASALAMVLNIFDCVINTLGSDRMLLLGGCIVAVGQLIQWDSHRRLAELSRSAFSPRSGRSTPKAMIHPAMSRVLQEDANMLDCMSPLSVHLDKPHPHSRSFDSLLISPGSRAVSRASSAALPDLDYKLPMGGMFELVSCPHYFGEVVIYLGFMVMQAGMGLSPVVLLWVVMNLSIAAQDTHAWYKSKFKEYPRQRKALFPLLW